MSVETAFEWLRDTTCDREVLSLLRGITAHEVMSHAVDYNDYIGGIDAYE